MKRARKPQQNNNMKAYKGTDHNRQCKNVQFETGKTYVLNGTLEMCRQGFHFCRKLADVHEFYSFAYSRLWEIDVPDDAEVLHDGIKSVTNKFTLVREIPFFEVMQMCNFNEDGKALTKLNTNLGFFNRGNDNRGNDNRGNNNYGNDNRGNNNCANNNRGNDNRGNDNHGK